MDIISGEIVQLSSESPPDKIGYKIGDRTWVIFGEVSRVGFLDIFSGEIVKLT